MNGMYKKWGSPPHTRGSLPASLLTKSGGGITPAHAGLTSFRTSPINRWWDHPRTRGAHFSTIKYASGYSGSPPHTRGSQFTVPSILYLIGITPAHAGLTNCLLECVLHSRDHPRTRGAHLLCGCQNIDAEGSPPHTRGSPEFTSAERTTDGITPAHAGLTITSIIITCLFRDHPRTRGAHNLAIAAWEN